MNEGALKRIIVRLRIIIHVRLIRVPLSFSPALLGLGSNRGYLPIDKLFAHLPLPYS